MTGALLAGIAGLAISDSLNPATLVAVTLILLGSRTRPVPEALGFVLGAFGSLLAVGLVIYFGAEAAAESLDGGLRWLRRGAFGLAAWRHVPTRSPCRSGRLARPASLRSSR